MVNQRLFGSFGCYVAATLLLFVAVGEAAGQQQTADRKGRNYRWASDKIQLDGPIPQDLPSEGTLVASEAEIAAEKKILAALAKKGSLEVTETFLVDVASELRDKLQVPIVFDHRSLQGGGVDPATAPVTLTIKDVSFEAILSSVLRPLELTWIIRDEALVVTTRTEADTWLETRVYAVQDLVLVKRGDFYTREPEELVSAIKEAIIPQSWTDTGGMGSVRFLGDTLIVSQTREIQARTADLIRTFRATRKLSAPTTETRIKVYDSHRPGGTACGQF
ncbi:MAG: hypothetical protein JSS27_09180 [Planctomycetes bacterium]|nr:hypothetical protein [Planctomycetota bacterium]